MTNTTTDLPGACHMTSGPRAGETLYTIIIEKHGAAWGNRFDSIERQIADVQRMVDRAKQTNTDTKYFRYGEGFNVGTVHVSVWDAAKLRCVPVATWRDGQKVG